MSFISRKLDRKYLDSKKINLEVARRYYLHRTPKKNPTTFTSLEVYTLIKLFSLKTKSGNDLMEFDVEFPNNLV